MVGGHCQKMILEFRVPDAKSFYKPCPKILGHNFCRPYRFNGRKLPLGTRLHANLHFHIKCYESL